VIDLNSDRIFQTKIKIRKLEKMREFSDIE